MKWNNKGKELEAYRDIFKDKNIFIYGAGTTGQFLYASMNIAKDNVIGWIDKKGGELCGLKVYRFSELSEDAFKNNIFIIAANEPLITVFCRQLMYLGLKENINFFRYSEWDHEYKFIYNLYRNNKVEISFCGMQISNVCNLNCKGCLSFTHFIKHQQFYGIDYLKHNLSSLFKNVDYVDMLELCGGEPFLVPEVETLYQYVGENFRDRIGTLSTVTNGTTLPSDDLCEVLKKYNVKVFVDDYRENVSKVRESFETVLEKLLSFGVKAEIRNVDSWIDIGIFDGKKKTEKSSIMRHAECNNDRMSLIDGKLFYCDYECYANMAGVFQANSSDYLEIYDKQIPKEEVVEFSLGYSKLGYTSMCSYCHGDGKVNTHLLKVAEQYEN